MRFVWRMRIAGKEGMNMFYDMGPRFPANLELDSLRTRITVRRRVIKRLERSGDPQNTLPIHRAQIAKDLETLKTMETANENGTKTSCD